jgi:apolipoprotein N-acyltransferase
VLCFAFGLTYYGILLSWLLPFGVVAWLPLVVVESLYAAAFGALIALLWRDRRPWLSALGAAGLWTFVDWFRATWPLGGFTWGGLGYTQHDDRLLLPLASVTGVWGITFVVLFANALAVLALLRYRHSPRRAAALASVGVAAIVAPVLIPFVHASGPPIDVAVVQGSVPRGLAEDRYLTGSVVAQNHIRLHGRLATDPPDLAVWPENALDRDPLGDPDLRAAVSGSIAAVGAPTLIGAVNLSPAGEWHNEVLSYSGRGELLGRYAKIHLVPFGEYVPFRRYFGWVDELRAVPRDILPGRVVRVFEIDGTSVGTPICFENTFPDLFRRFVDAGAEVVVLTTNDSSYAESPASREHVIMSELRAVETGRWVVQAAISGISAVVSPAGKVVVETALFEPAILRRTVPTSSVRTIYVRVGDAFPWMCGVGSLVLVGGALMRRRRDRRSDRGHGDGSAEAPGPTPPAGERTKASGEPAALPIAGSAPRTLVILPTYNERDTIARVVDGVLATGPAVDALVIDDGSPDGTGDVVARIASHQPRVRLRRRPRKMGLASAYMEGFRQGLSEGYDVLVEMDSDLSHRPEDLSRVLEGATRHDLTIGSRYVPGGAVTNWSPRRLRLSRAGNAYARIALRIPLSDATSGFRAFRRGALQRILEHPPTSDGYAFQIEMAYRAWRDGWSVGEVPITFREREHGRSKISRRIVAEALWRVAVWGVRDRVRGRPPQPSRPPQ